MPHFTDVQTELPARVTARRLGNGEEVEILTAGYAIDVDRTSSPRCSNWYFKKTGETLTVIKRIPVNKRIVGPAGVNRYYLWDSAKKLGPKSFRVQDAADALAQAAEAAVSPGASTATPAGAHAPVERASSSSSGESSCSSAASSSLVSPPKARAIIRGTEVGSSVNVPATIGATIGDPLFFVLV
jgi:hypothetical protein